MSAATPYPTVVIYSFFPWLHEYPSTAHGLARALASYTQVIYISKPPTLKDVLSGVAASQAQRQEAVAAEPLPANLSVFELPARLPINFLQPGRLYDAATKINDGRLSAAVQRVLAKAGVTTYVWINLYAPDQLIDLNVRPVPAQRIYYSVDAIEQARYTARHGALAEQRQLTKADFGLATSQQLAKSLSSRRLQLGLDRRAVTVLPNAMDDGNFRAELKQTTADPIAEIKGPRAVYVGNLDGARIDFEGLTAFAKTRHDIEFVLIGPWNASEIDRANLDALDNVHLLGRKSPEESAIIMAHCHVGLIPFKCTALTAAIYPLKINEYLALGLPVLSTAFSMDIQSFAEVITLAPLSEWSQLVDQTLGSNNGAEKAARQAVAAHNTWDARATQLLALISGKEVAPQVSSASQTPVTSC